MDTALGNRTGPSYPGAHGTISAAGADILSSIYGNNFAFTVTSPALPGVARAFVSFSEAAHEATVSRIYNGNHSRLDQVAGGEPRPRHRRVRARSQRPRSAVGH